MLWWQVLLIGILYYLSDSPWPFGEGFYVLQRPLVAGFLVGLVLGDPVQGTMIGAVINLVFIGVINVGGAVPSDMSLPGYLGTAIVVSAGLDTYAALALSVPLGLLGTALWVGKMTLNSLFVRMADEAVETGNIRRMKLMAFLPGQLIILAGKLILTAVVLVFCAPALGAWLGGIENPALLSAFAAVGQLLPALGIALNLRTILKKDIWPALAVGFLLAAYRQVSVMGAALVGLAFAALYMFFAPRREETIPAPREEKPRRLLSDSDVKRSFWLWQFFSHANYNYRRYQGTSVALCMAGVLEKLYPDEPEKVQAGLRRHLRFFNTDPNLGSMIHGVVLSMEESRALGADVSEDLIEATKTGLMGPIAGIGDSVIQGVIIPILVSVGISCGVQGDLRGPLMVLFLLPLILILISRAAWLRGYRLGTQAVSELLSHGRMRRLIDGACVLGCTVMGALISLYVTVSTPLTVSFGGAVFSLQSAFDAVLPDLLPLLSTMGIYLVLKKGKVSLLWTMVALAAVAFVGGYVGVF